MTSNGHASTPAPDTVVYDVRVELLEARATSLERQVVELQRDRDTARAEARMWRWGCLVLGGLALVGAAR